MKLTEVLASHIRDIPDFPHAGVVFKDYSSLLATPEAFGAMVAALCEVTRSVRAEKVLGIDARGFVLGAPIAIRTDIGFVAARKEGKLPGNTISRSYELEYGNAALEIHKGIFTLGERVIVVDDVLATGGTANAAIELVRETGAEVVAAAFAIEIAGLGGRHRLEKNARGAGIHSLLVM